MLHKTSLTAEATELLCYKAAKTMLSLAPFSRLAYYIAHGYLKQRHLRIYTVVKVGQPVNAKCRIYLRYLYTILCEDSLGRQRRCM
jgi:hypothetical protein